MELRKNHIHPHTPTHNHTPYTPPPPPTLIHIHTYPHTCSPPNSCSPQSSADQKNLPHSGMTVFCLGSQQADNKVTTWSLIQRLQGRISSSFTHVVGMIQLLATTVLELPFLRTVTRVMLCTCSFPPSLATINVSNGAVSLPYFSETDVLSGCFFI